MKTSPQHSTAAPLSFEIDDALAARLKEINERLGGYPLSQVVALALEKYDFASMKISPAERRQLSVRLPQDQRERLESAAKTSGVSMAHLIRLALEAFAAISSKGTSVRTLQKELATRRGRRASTNSVAARVEVAAGTPAPKASSGKKLKKVAKKATRTVKGKKSKATASAKKGKRKASRR